MLNLVMERSALFGASVPLHPQKQLSQTNSTPRSGGLLVVGRQLTSQERTQKRHRSLRHKVESLATFRCGVVVLLLPRVTLSSNLLKCFQVVGRPDRPRLAVYRSNNHIYAQVIDDTAGNTLCTASTLTKDIRQSLNGSSGGNKDAAELVGKRIAELCLAKNIAKVSFDRGGHIYHGRIKALADAAREGGLNF
eukprot:jgi/Botrbrau1/13723/Bobra.0356s0004.1